MKPKKTPIEVCEKHNAPLVKVNGQSVCIGEYFNACIGPQKVVDVIQEGKTTWFVFQDGHAVPLLCFCCGQPLAVADLDDQRQDVIGRKLVSTAAQLVEADNGSEHVQFLLELSSRQLFGKKRVIPLSLDVAAKMRHPDTCPNKPAPVKKDARCKKKR